MKAMPDIKLVVGLGNPGAEYVYTRHNAGFWFADELARHGNGSWTGEKKFHGDVATIQINNEPVRLLKPSTFMNVSGRAVQALLAYLKLTPQQVLVAHDEIDLPVGTVRLKHSGGHGGHNGLRDVSSHIGKEYYRLRLGVGHPGHADAVHGYVLKRAPSEEERAIEEAVRDAVDVMPKLLEQGLEKAMTQLHSRGVEPKAYKKEQVDED